MGFGVGLLQPSPPSKTEHHRKCEGVYDVNLWNFLVIIGFIDR